MVLVGIGDGRLEPDAVQGFLHPDQLLHQLVARLKIIARVTALFLLAMLVNVFARTEPVASSNWFWKKNALRKSLISINKLNA